MLGIVGHSGAGKTTIANLINRLYDVDSGEITIDGVNVKNIALRDLRANIGVVSQETYLFMGTIAENIAYAKPGATMEEIFKAAKAAHAHDFIIKLPDGYDTVIGRGGRDLSGGERQRISIARAILYDPKILILDEATSAMDTETEGLIQDALDKLVKGRTTISIAHRLSTLRNADKLIVLDGGKIVESGTHSELIGLKGTYYKLVQKQSEALKMRGVGD
jgi:ATP-binding cassette subfamily B protein